MARVAVYDEVRILGHVIEAHFRLDHLSLGYVGDKLAACIPALFYLLYVNRSSSCFRVDRVDEFFVRNLDPVDTCSWKTIVVIRKEDWTRAGPEPLEVPGGFEIDDLLSSRGYFREPIFQQTVSPRSNCHDQFLGSNCLSFLCLYFEARLVTKPGDMFFQNLHSVAASFRGKGLQASRC